MADFLMDPNGALSEFPATSFTATQNTDIMSRKFIPLTCSGSV
ncbi:hypothetical protein [Legionella septentrionalis]|nr:hypothetical protein [Legionella septentrionalis]